MKTQEVTIPCVLAVDDSPEVHELLEVRLRPEGLHLVTASSYDEGLKLAREILPDLILLDVDMPEHSGLDLCRRLKDDPMTSNIPVIFLTGSSEVETKVHGFDLGAIDYVTKPFHPAELRARVRAALRMKRSQDLLTQKAQVDALTGLRNRAHMDERLTAEVAGATRSGRPLSLVMLDLDHFKHLNDAFGHPFGDLVLQRVGDLLARSVRPCDVACRYGGEELAVILTDTTIVGAHAVAERIRNEIRTLDLAPRGRPVMVTASFGVAEAIDLASRGGELRVSALVAAADGALYAAKRDGRDCVRLHHGGERDTLSPPRETLFPPRDGSSPRRDSTLPRRESRIVPTAA
jgi:two-component system cell cycle response regulator